MSLEERRELVVKNRDKGQGKGVKREYVINESVQCSDKLALQQDKPFLTRKQPLVETKHKHV